MGSAVTARAAEGCLGNGPRCLFCRSGTLDADIPGICPNFPLRIDPGVCVAVVIVPDMATVGG